MTRSLLVAALLALAGCVEQSPTDAPVYVSAEVDFNSGVHWFEPGVLAGAGERAASYIKAHPREHVVSVTAVRTGSHDGLLILTTLDGGK